MSEIEVATDEKEESSDNKFYFEEDKIKIPSKRNGVTKTQALKAVRTMIQWAGDDPDREGLVETPMRVVKSYLEFFKGYNVDPAMILNKSFSETEGYKDMIILDKIRTESFCCHHLVPFIGETSVGYIPNGKVCGISKLARVVEAYSKRLQIQEALCQQICNCIFSTLSPLGCGVVISCGHQCLETRGIHKPGARMITSSMMGNFEDLEIQKRFLARIGMG